MAYASGKLSARWYRKELYGLMQAQPQTVFNWQFWERAAQDPKMTSYLTHGVKEKMVVRHSICQSVGAHHDCVQGST